MWICLNFEYGVLGVRYMTVSDLHQSKCSFYFLGWLLCLLLFLEHIHQLNLSVRTLKAWVAKLRDQVFTHRRGLKSYNSITPG